MDREHTEDAGLNPEDEGLNRREFIKGAVAGSAVLASSGLPKALEAETTDAKSYAHAALRGLPPGAIRPEGWVRAHLEAQAKLAGALRDISWPFSAGYWEGLEDFGAWFPWEQKAYWVDGCTRLALLLGDDALLAKSRTALDYTLKHASESGFLGPRYLEYGDSYGGLQRWPNNVLFRGYMALADADPAAAGADGAAIAEALRRHYLGDTATYGDGSRNITNIEPILWCYGRTGDKKLLALAEGAWDKFVSDAEAEFKSPGQNGRRHFSSHTDLAPSRVYADAPIETHGVSYAEVSKLPAILYLHTGNEELRRFAVAAQRRIFDHHMLIDGIPSSAEGFAGITALDQHETCDISDHAWSWEYMLMATGDGAWGDRIERACFNAHPGTTRTDWKGCQYFSSANQFIATLNSDHGQMRPGSRRLAYQPNPAQFIACCGGNKHRFFPNYVLGMWMRTQDNGLAATLYGPSTVTAKVGAENREVQILQKTSYPFEEKIQLEVKCGTPVTFALWLRLPGWCRNPRIAVNGSSASVRRQNGFAVVRRAFKNGDTIALTFPMEVKATEWPDHGVGFERGPLVYAMPIEAKWSSLAEACYSSDEFPTWEATPASDWNYGVALDPARAASRVEVDVKPAAQNLSGNPWPWSDSPVTLTVPARKIEGWKLQPNPKNPNSLFTPPLPVPGSYQAGGKIERIKLVPYGATQLRMSVFPKLNG